MVVTAALHVRKWAQGSQLGGRYSVSRLWTQTWPLSQATLSHHLDNEQAHSPSLEAVHLSGSEHTDHAALRKSSVIGVCLLLCDMS